MTHPNGRTTIRKGVAVPLCLALLVTCGAANRADAQTHAYVANTNANVVTVIDTATNAVTGAIGVGIAPAHVAISQDATRAYVTNTGSNSVSVIDTATECVVATIPVGEHPSSIAVAPRGDRLYVMDGNAVLEVIDTASNAVVGSIAVGGSDGQIAVSPDGSHVYVASGTVSVIDTATNHLVASFAPEETASPDVSNFAVGVAVSPDGTRAYVPVLSYYFDFRGFSAGGGVAIIDTATNAVTQTIPLFSVPGAIAFTADGSRAYVGIQAFWANTGYGAAFLPGRWLAAIDTASRTTVDWIDLGADGPLWSLQHTPAGLAVTPDRSGVYVSIPAIDAVAAVDTVTNALKEIIPVASGPVGLAILPDPSADVSPYLIEAVNDRAASPLPALSAGVAIANVLANDTIGGAPAAVGNVALSLVSSTSASVTVDAASGAVWIGADAEVGNHSLTYEICDAAAPGNCARAEVTLAVRPPYVIDAANDRATSFAGAAAIASVVANDTLEGAQAALTTVAVSLVSSDPGIGFNPGDGSVSVAAGTPAGDHALVYRICEIASPANCDEAAVTVTVASRLIHAENDSATAPRTGAAAIANVLANDTLDGAPATTSRVILSGVSSTNAGLTLDAATGFVSVAPGTAAGPHMLGYRICEAASQGNCSEGSITVTVSSYLVTAAADQARASSKRAGIAIGSVLANDTIGGSAATVANVNLSLVSMSPSNSKIRLNPNGSVETLGKSSSGLFTLLYQICEAGSATNCSRATVTLDLSGKD